MKETAPETNQKLNLQCGEAYIYVFVCGIFTLLSHTLATRHFITLRSPAVLLV
jgi:hypothetical protein